MFEKHCYNLRARKFEWHGPLKSYVVGDSLKRYMIFIFYRVITAHMCLIAQVQLYALSRAVGGGEKVKPKQLFILQCGFFFFFTSSSNLPSTCMISEKRRTIAWKWKTLFLGIWAQRPRSQGSEYNSISPYVMTLGPEPPMKCILLWCTFMCIMLPFIADIWVIWCDVNEREGLSSSARSRSHG